MQNVKLEKKSESKEEVDQMKPHRCGYCKKVMIKNLFNFLPFTNDFVITASNNKQPCVLYNPELIIFRFAKILS